jgi:hypothetical protein
MKIAKIVFIASVAIFTASLLLHTGCGCNPNHPGTGEKIGQVVKLSYGGVIKDTWEGQLIRGGMNNGSGSFGTTPFDFTVEDPKLVPIVQAYMSNQTEVVIKYRREGVYSVFRSDSHGAFLIEITPVKK